MKTNLKSVLEKIKANGVKIDEIIKHPGNTVKLDCISIGGRPPISFKSIEECKSSIQSSIDKIMYLSKEYRNLKTVRNWLNHEITISDGYFKGKKLIDVLMTKELIKEHDWFVNISMGLKRLEKDAEFNFSKSVEEKNKDLSTELRELNERFLRNGKKTDSDEFNKQKEEIENRFKVERVQWAGFKNFLEDLSEDSDKLLSIIEEAIQSANSQEVDIPDEFSFESVGKIQLKIKDL